MCLWTEAAVLCSYQHPETSKHICNNEIGVKRTVQQACEAFSAAQRHIWPEKLVLDESWDRELCVQTVGAYGCIVAEVDGRFRQRDRAIRMDQLCDHHQAEEDNFRYYEPESESWSTRAPRRRR